MSSPLFRFRICNFPRHNDFHRAPKSAVEQLSDTAPIIMALRLKKDVQKASYYVWFLGAQESKELRGERVLVSTIPRLIDRSRHQEPLKVTLQISHKGLKIIQVSVGLLNRTATCQLPNIPRAQRNSNHFQFSRYFTYFLFKHIPLMRFQHRIEENRKNL